MDVYKAPAAPGGVARRSSCAPHSGRYSGAIADLVVSAALFISFTLFMGATWLPTGSSQEDVTRFFMSLE